MVACDPPRNDLEFPLHGNLADKVADPEGDRPDKNRFAGPSGSRPDGPCSHMGCAVRSGIFALVDLTTTGEQGLAGAQTPYRTVRAVFPHTAPRWSL